MKILKLALAAGALASVNTLAVAQEAVPAQPNAAQAEQGNKRLPRMQARFERLDANKDGSIDSQEFATAQNLKDADTNGDGTLSNEELVTMIQKRQVERQARQLTRRLDVDRDGKVTIAEIEQQRGKRFALMDRNNDGKLEASEMRGNRKDGPRKHHRHGNRPMQGRGF